MTEKVEHTELPWSVWVEPIADADQAKKELGLLVEGTPDFRPHLVYLCGPNNLAPAVTGCGEKSIANAEYIVLACNSYPALLAERDRMRETLNEALRLCSQVESDLKSAHAEICTLQNLDPKTHTWPVWTQQANTLRWIANLRVSWNAALKDTNQ